jgi:hypothetical protein
MLYSMGELHLHPTFLFFITPAGSPSVGCEGTDMLVFFLWLLMFQSNQFPLIYWDFL